MKICLNMYKFKKKILYKPFAIIFITERRNKITSIPNFLRSVHPFVSRFRKASIISSNII